MTANPDSSPPKLMEQVRTVTRLRGMSYRTEQTYCDWIRRFILFHDKRHPKDMGVSESYFIFHIPFASCHFSLRGGRAVPLSNDGIQVEEASYGK